MSSAVELEQLRSRFNSLSPRQHQVMELVVAGLSSKEIGRRLNLSGKTVDNHRLGYGTNWCTKSRGTCADGDKYSGGR
jgi:FixJ family two-component response regulator